MPLQWAKARQGEKIKWEKLPLPARLSCKAGKLAEEARRAHPAQLEALRAPSNAAQAYAGSKATNSKLKPATRMIAQAPKALDHACRSNSWSERAFRMAGWEARKPAVPPSQLPGRLASKLIHRLLPFGKRAKRYREYYLPQCLPCPAEAGVAPAGPEGQARFFRRRRPRRRGLLKKMPGAARKASEGCDASFQLAGLLQKRMQAHWDGRKPRLECKEGALWHFGAPGMRWGGAGLSGEALQAMGCYSWQGSSSHKCGKA